MVHTRRFKTCRYIACAVTVFCLVGLAPNVLAADLTKIEFQAVLLESVAALLTGQEFSPSLQKKQQTMRKMLETGTVSKAELTAMVEANMLSILDHHQTSRYIMNEISGPIDQLFSPYLDWEAVKVIAWKVSASLVPDGDKMIITMGTLAPSGTPWINLPETVLIPRMAKLSNNKFAIKIYTGGVMGEDTDILRKMDIGQLDGCGCTALGILAASPEASVLLLPGLFNNYEEVDYITTKFRKRFDAAFEKKGYILSSFIDSGFFYLFSKHKVLSLADLRKQKVLTWLGEIEPTLFKELGVDATPMAVTEIVSAISTGLANTNMAPAAWMLGMQAYQYRNYFIKEPMFHSPGAAFVSVKTKERLRKKYGLSEMMATNIQEMLIHEVGMLETEWKKQSRSYEAKCMVAFEEKCGMKAVTLSDEDKKTLEQVYSRVREEVAGKAFPRDFMEEIEKALDDYRTRKN